MISQRAKSLIQNPSAIMVGYSLWKENPYNSDNTSGVLNFGIAENHLMEEEILFLLDKKSDLKREHIHYCNTCSNRNDFKYVEIPYACKLMFQELLTMNIAPRILCE